MKIVGDVAPGIREHPHIVTLGTSRNTRWLVNVRNEAVAPGDQSMYSFHGEGAVDVTGCLTGIGRGIVPDSVNAAAVGSVSTTCIVWGPDECTYVLRDGNTVEGRRTPKGDPIDSEKYAANNAHVVVVRWVAHNRGRGQSCQSG